MKKAANSLFQLGVFPNMWFRLVEYLALVIAGTIFFTWLRFQPELILSPLLVPAIIVGLFPLIVFFGVLRIVKKRRKEILSRLSPEFEEWKIRTEAKINKTTRNMWKGAIVGASALFISFFLLELFLVRIVTGEGDPILTYGLLLASGFLFLWTILPYFSEGCLFEQRSVDGAIDANVFLLFPFATKELSILTGELNPLYWGDERIIQSLKYLKEKGTKLTICCTDPREYKAETEEEKEALGQFREIIRKYDREGLGNAFRFLSLPEERPNHYAIASMFFGFPLFLIRFEEIHKEWWQRKNAREGVKNSLILFNLPLYWYLRKDFREKVASSIRVEEIK